MRLVHTDSNPSGGAVFVCVATTKQIWVQITSLGFILYSNIAKNSAVVMYLLSRGASAAIGLHCVGIHYSAGL